MVIQVNKQITKKTLENISAVLICDDYARKKRFYVDREAIEKRMRESNGSITVYDNETYQADGFDLEIFFIDENIRVHNCSASKIVNGVRRFINVDITYKKVGDSWEFDDFSAGSLTPSLQELVQWINQIRADKIADRGSKWQKKTVYLVSKDELPENIILRKTFAVPPVTPIFQNLNGYLHRAPVKKVVRKPVCKNKVNKMVGNIKKYENSVRNML